MKLVNYVDRSNRGVVEKSYLRGPTHQKWSNFAIFGFIVQFDPWVGAHLWLKN